VTGVRDGLIDVIAGRADLLIPGGPSRIIIRRGLNPANGSTLPVLDFNAAEAFAPVTRILTVNNAGADQLTSNTAYLTANGTGGVLISARGLHYYGIPAAQQQAADRTSSPLRACPGHPGGAAIRHLQDAVKTLTARRRTVADDGNRNYRPYVVPGPCSRSSRTTTDWLIRYANAGGAQNSSTLQVWEGYAPAPPLTSDTGFSTVVGWQNAWGLQTGSQVRWTPR
jgi:hypothetical protein